MKRILVVLIASLALFFVGCGDLADDGDIDTIILAGGVWDSFDLHNDIVQVIIEEGYGYETEVQMGSTAATFQGSRQGDIHIYMDVWTNAIKEINEEGIECGDIIKVAINLDDNV